MKLGRLAEFFQDGTGAMSATRLAFLVTIFAVMGVWVNTCIQTKTMAKFDNGTIYLIGVLMVGKVSQSFTENQTDSSDKTIIGK